MTWRSSSKISNRSVLDSAGKPETTRTSRNAPTPIPSSPPFPEATTWQLLTKFLYPCGLSKRRTTDHTVDTGASMDWITEEQHWCGPTPCAWCRARASGRRHGGDGDAVAVKACSLGKLTPVAMAVAVAVAASVEGSKRWS